MAALTAACLQKALFQLLIKDISTEDDCDAYEEQHNVVMHLLGTVIGDVRVTLGLSDVSFRDDTSAGLL